MTGPGAYVRSERPERLDPSPRQLEALRTFAETGDQRTAAQRMGISYQTYKNHQTEALRRLDVTSSIEAFRLLGWLVPR